MSQFQPYRAGWETSPVRLAPKTTAVTTEVTAAMEPAIADRIGAARAPVPGSSALRLPMTAAAGRPALAAALAMADGCPPAAAVGRCRTDRAASTASRLSVAMAAIAT